MTTLADVRRILEPAVDAIEEGKHPDIGDAMNLLGRLVGVVEHLAAVIDEGLGEGG